MATYRMRVTLERGSLDRSKPKGKRWTWEMLDSQSSIGILDVEPKMIVTIPTDKACQGGIIGKLYNKE